jgi:hypothetical protein
MVRFVFANRVNPNGGILAVFPGTTHIPAFTVTFIDGVPNADTFRGLPPDGMIPPRTDKGVSPPCTSARDTVDHRVAGESTVSPSDTPQPITPATVLAISDPSHHDAGRNATEIEGEPTPGVPSAATELSPGANSMSFANDDPAAGAR